MATHQGRDNTTGQPPSTDGQPGQLRGVMRIVCPGCHRPTRSHLGEGWTVTWCNKCRHYFRTANEILTPELMGQYQLSAKEEAEEPDDKQS